MNRLFGLGGILLMLLAAQAALAQHGRERGRFAPAQAGPAPKPAPVQQISAPSPEGARGGRLTFEERQQLRRDVNNHGREIYRDRTAPKRPPQ